MDLLAPDRNGSFGIPPDPPCAREHRVLPAMLEEQLRRALDRRREGGTLRGLRCYDTTSTATGKASGVPSQQQPALVDFSSNDYIGLARSADLRRAFMDKMQGVKGRPLGSTGSRLLDGNSSEYEEVRASGLGQVDVLVECVLSVWARFHVFPPARSSTGCAL